MYDVLTELGYEYDTSQIRGFAAPARTQYKGKSWTLTQFALMKLAGSAAVPMDYNYFANKVGGDRMKQDYRNSIVASYRAGHLPWNIGHHFALWDSGHYWTAMQDAFEFAANGCPDSDGTNNEKSPYQTFRELNAKIAAKADEFGDVFSYDYETLPTESECGDCVDSH